MSAWLPNVTRRVTLPSMVVWLLPSAVLFRAGAASFATTVVRGAIVAIASIAFFVG